MTGSKELYRDAIVDLASIHNKTDQKEKISEAIENLAGLLILDDHARHTETANYNSIIDCDSYGQLMLLVGIYMTTTDQMMKDKYSYLIAERLSLNANKYFLNDILDDIQDKQQEILESKYDDSAYDAWAEEESSKTNQRHRYANQIYGIERQNGSIQRIASSNV